LYLRGKRWYLAPLIKLLRLERTFHMRLSSRA
jgi:hypothetical protein